MKPSPRIAITVYFFLLGFVFSSWASHIPDIKDKFSLNDAELGSILFMLPLGALCSLPFSGLLVAKIGSRWMSILSLIIYVLTLLGISLANTTLLLSIILFLFGMFGNFGNISLNAQGISIQHYIKKSILSSLHAMWSVGAFTAAALTDWVMEEEITQQEHYFFIAIVMCLMTLPLFFSLVKDPEQSNKNQKIFAWPTKALLLLGLICFCGAMSEGTMADWSSLYYRQVINQPHVASALGYTAFALFMSIGRFVGDPLIERWGHGTILKANGILIAIGMITALVSTIPALVMVGFALVGLGVSSIFPVVYILASKEKSMLPSAALAAVSSIGFIGFLVGPPVIGFIAEGVGLRSALMAVVLLGTIIVLLASKQKPVND